MLEGIKSIYIIGIGGISLSAIARMLKDRGYFVYGSDVANSKIIRQLKKDGIPVRIGSATNFVLLCDAVVVSSAISKDNKDVMLAKSFNKPIFSRAEILNHLSKGKKVISVAGTHGKTTTTGMLASICLCSGLDPTVHIGGILNNIHSNLHIGKGDLFITEACEYQDNFLLLDNYISIILNVQKDHLDYFKNLDNLFSSFSKFANNTDKNGVIICNFDQKDERLNIKDREILTFGLEDGAMVQGKNILKMDNGKYQFDIFYRDQFQTTVFLPCYGRHNIYNALACATCALFLGISVESIKKGIEDFQGIERRFEIIKEGKNIIIHDYAHHPTEIRASLKACRDIVKDEKLITIFQPHTYSRTRDLFEEFLTCFDESDEVWFLPIYPAREQPIEGVSSENLTQKLSERGKIAKFFPTFSSCYEEINKREDVKMFAVLGAGDIEKLASMFKSDK